MKKHPDFCPACKHRIFNMDDGSCALCSYFCHTEKCIGCEAKITSIAEHTCNQCGYLVCEHDCPPAVIEEKVISVSFDVKVIVHEEGKDFDVFDTLEEAVKVWAFEERQSDWDQEACHVAQDEAGHWLLLHM